LRPELAASPSIVRRFVREGYAANRVGHPGAVAVLDDGVAEDGSIFLVMDLLEGETLGARLVRQGPMPVGAVFRCVDVVLEVLASAHAHGIVHRDIKPENIFITIDETIRVLDFGIARVRELSREQGATESGVMMGTPAFMPPEQARGQTARISGRTDLWALGATMYTMLTGKHVRAGATASEELFLAMTTPVASITEVLPSIVPAVAVIVDRALAFEPEERWASAQAMRDAIANAPTHVESLEPVPARRRRGRFVATVVLALGGVVALWIVASLPRGAHETIPSASSASVVASTLSELRPALESSAVSSAATALDLVSPAGSNSTPARARRPSGRILTSLPDASPAIAEPVTIPMAPRDPLDRHH
jgi:eukaryotic-like serine/threonine-protein kinase